LDPLLAPPFASTHFAITFWHRLGLPSWASSHNGKKVFIFKIFFLAGRGRAVLEFLLIRGCFIFIFGVLLEFLF
jgi:hypothetical protein